MSGGLSEECRTVWGGRGARKSSGILSYVIFRLRACKPCLGSKPNTGGRVAAGKVSNKAGGLIPREAHHPTVLASPCCLLQVESGLLRRGLAGPSVPCGEEPARSVYQWMPTASCKLQALPLHRPHPLPHQNVPRACLLRRHWDLGCAGWWSHQKTRRRYGTRSCLAWPLAGSAPLDSCPSLPGKKTWSAPQTGLRGTLRGARARRGGALRGADASPVN